MSIGIRSEHTRVTWENNHDGDTRTVHGESPMTKGRLMVLALHNTDTGDGAGSGRRAIITSTPFGEDRLSAGREHRVLHAHPLTA